MKDFTVMTADEKQAYIMELYNQLTPENKKLAIAKYYELLAEQEAEK